MDEKYSMFYTTELGRKILRKELEKVALELKDCKHILSIGCGPGILESELAKIHQDIRIIGLDKSEEMLYQVKTEIPKVLGDAEKLNFEDKSFDAVLFITSLEFVEDYRKAVLEAFRVLRNRGIALILMLNPESEYFKEKYADNDSYIHRNIRHMEINEMEEFIARYFTITTEYFLGIKGQEVFDSEDKRVASLYMIKGIKKEWTF